MTRNNARRLLFLAPVFLGGAVLLSVALLLSARHSDHSSRNVIASHTITPVQEVAQRSNVLTACIQTTFPSTPINTQVFADTIATIKTRLARWPNARTEFLDGAYAVVGCPQELLDRPTVYRGQPPPDARQFRLFISVLPADEFRTRFGDRPYAKNTVMYCSGDVCGSETTGLYVPSLDPDVLFEGVVDTLGLVQALYAPTGTAPS